MRLRSVVLAVPLAGALVVAAPHAHAGVAWGDASLVRDDVRIQLGPDGNADVTHTIAVKVAAKRFKAFVIDGVDPGAEPPDDETTKAGLDGPGWPAIAVDAKGTTFDALVEPAKEPRRLRVRLGLEGVPRGQYTITLRYRVDLSRSFTRDGAMLRFTWTAPRWPEGYDAARIVVAVPSSPTAPRVSIGEPGLATGPGAFAEHDADGVALVSVNRGPVFDEVEIERPHVPSLDDTRWVVRVDPKALPGVAAPLGTVESNGATGIAPGASPFVRRASFLGAGLAGLAFALLLRRRDAAADVAARDLGSAFRPLVPLPAAARAVGYGVAVTSAVAATIADAPLVSASAVVAAIGLATLRAPLPPVTTRGPGRWLAVPKSAVPTAKRRVVSLLDPGGRVGAALTSVAVIAIVALAAFVARIHARAAVALLIDAAALLPLFATGRGAQLPKDRVGDAWRVLSRIEPRVAAAAAASGAQTKVVARMAKSGEAGAAIDEVRLRVDPATREVVRSIEVGCAMSHSAAGTSLVPEILVRVDAALAERFARVDGDAFDWTAGRTEDERVLAVRPESSAAVARWVSWALAHGCSGEGARAKAAETPALRATTTASPQAST